MEFSIYNLGEDGYFDFIFIQIRISIIGEIRTCFFDKNRL